MEGGGAFNESGVGGGELLVMKLGVGGHPCIIDMFKKDLL